MSEWIRPAAEWSSALLEALGIAIIAALAASSLAYAAFKLAARQSPEIVFHEMRQRLGRGILLGLEFMVAADIIHTVALDLTFESVGVLAAVVAIRTFLSFTLEVELTGNWPWQSKSGSSA